MANPLVDLTDEQLDALIAQKQAAAQNDEGAQPKASPSVSSSLTDAAKSIPTGLEETAMTAATAPNTVGKLVAQGANAAGDYAFPDWKTSPPGKVMSAAENYFGAKDYTTGQKKVEDAVGPLYQPQTTTGKIVKSAVSAAPLGALGEGAMIPNMVRALASGGASEAAGQATAGTPWEIPARLVAGAGAYGASGMAQTPRITANTPRAAAAQTLENAGVPVRASDISGSRLTATLEGGGAPGGYDTALSNSMKQQGGIVRPPGNTDQYSQLVDARRNALQAQGNQLGAQTAIPATPQLRQQLATDVGNHLRTVGGVNAANDTAVQQGLNTYDQLVMGQPSLDGSHYQALRQEWNSSGNPTLRTMASHLDDAMDHAHPGVWDGWRQNWADYEGLRAAADKLGGEATLKPLSPDAVVNAMHRRTPMRDTAEAAQTIGGARPQPYNPDIIGKLGHLAGAVGGLTGFTGVPGAFHGGYEPGLYGAIYPEVAAQGVKALTSLVPSVFSTGGGQRVLRNMDPRVVSALLAQQGIRPKGGAAEQPQNTGQ